MIGEIWENVRTRFLSLRHDHSELISPPFPLSTITGGATVQPMAGTYIIKGGLLRVDM